NGGFAALFSNFPNYLKFYDEHALTRGFSGGLSESQSINYEVGYLDLYDVSRLTAGQFFTDTLRDTEDSKVLSSITHTVNKIDGIEATVTAPRVGYSKMLCFVLGAEVYLLKFSAKTEQKLSADEIDYFVQHFRILPTGRLNTLNTTSAKPPATLDVDPS